VCAMSIRKENKIESGKSKRRGFNFIDFLLLLMVALMIFLAVYVIKPVSLFQRYTKQNVYTVEYTVEFEAVDVAFIDKVSAGDTCIDSVSKSDIGEVVDVDGNTVYTVLEYNEETEAGVLSEYPEKHNLLVNIRVECTYAEGTGYTVNGTRIAVGEKMSIRFPDFLGEGYCIGFTVMD